MVSIGLLFIGIIGKIRLDLSSDNTKMSEDEEFVIVNGWVLKQEDLL